MVQGMCSFIFRCAGRKRYVRYVFYRLCGVTLKKQDRILERPFVLAGSPFCTSLRFSSVLHILDALTGHPLPRCFLLPRTALRVALFLRRRSAIFRAHRRQPKPCSSRTEIFGQLPAASHLHLAHEHAEEISIFSGFAVAETDRLASTVVGVGVEEKRDRSILIHRNPFGCEPDGW